MLTEYRIFQPARRAEYGGLAGVEETVEHAAQADRADHVGPPGGSEDCSLYPVSRGKC